MTARPFHQIWRHLAITVALILFLDWLFSTDTPPNSIVALAIGLFFGWRWRCHP